MIMMIIPVTAQQYIILGWLMMMNNITNKGGIMYNSDKRTTNSYNANKTLRI
jgi:hypothetical protein